ncbi:MAG: metallophosphoesterase [Anaerolineae bacterium]
MQLSRRKFLKAFGQVALGYGLAAVGGYEYSARIETTWLQVERVTVPLKGLRSGLEGFKIVHLSDIHLHPFIQIDLVREAVDIANGLQPDLVVLTGDYVLERAGSIFELAPALARLNARYGVFAALGNHDLWTDASLVQAGLVEAGLPVLRNSGLALGVGQEQLYLAGLDDAWSGRPDLPAALAGLPPDAPAILLVHEPDFADEFSRDGRVALQLSGHSHGGQVRLPLIGAPVLPMYGRKYDMGLYRVNNMWLYTNRGLGMVGPPLRFNCRPEITELTLVGAA